MFRLVLGVLWPIDSDCGYMFRLVLSILLPMNNNSGYMFRLVIAIPLLIDSCLLLHVSASVSHSVAYA